MRVLRLLAMAFGACALLVLGFVVAGKYPETSQQAAVQASVDEGSKPMAIVAARNFVRAKLKSPSTASFPTSDGSEADKIGPGRYRVLSYVDAQNSFGGTIRTHFDVTVKRQAGDWVLESIEME